jgi:hypothetical protein
MRFRRLAPRNAQPLGGLVRLSVWATLASAAALLTCAALLAPSVAGASPNQFVLIKNARNKSAAITKADAKDLFTGKRKLWSTGEVVQVVVRAGEGDGIQWLAEDVFGVSPRNLLTKIRQEVFKGEMAKPIIAASDDEIIKQVVSIGGAIGVIPAPVAAKLPAEAVVLPINN